MAFGFYCRPNNHFRYSNWMYVSLWAPLMHWKIHWNSNEIRMGKTYAIFTISYKILTHLLETHACSTRWMKSKNHLNHLSLERIFRCNWSIHRRAYNKQAFHSCSAQYSTLFYKWIHLHIAQEIALLNLWWFQIHTIDSSFSSFQICNIPNIKKFDRNLKFWVFLSILQIHYSLGVTLRELLPSSFNNAR